MASKPNLPVVVTANALLEGDVVYVKADGSWSRSLQKALVLRETKDADSHLQTATAQSNLVVGAYLIPVELNAGRLETIHSREYFRKTGPSNYFHGKQTEKHYV